MPVLPLWWTQGMGVSTSTYLGVLAMVSMGALVLDVPFSLLADKVGNKCTLAVGLGIFSLSFLFAATGDGAEAFYRYAFTNTLAEGLLSGSSTALLREVVGEREYRRELFSLNNRYYTYTSALFFVGVFGYLLLPRLLLVIQSIMLMLACFFVASIRLGPSAQKRKAHEPLRTLTGTESVPGFYRYVIGAFAICVLFGFFNGLMQFQNRTIQLLASEIVVGDINPLWISAALLFAGNILTSLGVGKTAEQSMQRFSQVTITFVLLGTALSATLLLSLGSGIAVFVGYCLICILKGAYRAEYTDLAVKVQPSKEHAASWLSIINSAACLIAASINLIASYFANSGIWGAQIVWAIAAGVVALVSVPSLLAARTACLAAGKRGMSPKRSFLMFDFDSHEPPLFIQEYPDARYRDALLANYGLLEEVTTLSYAPLAKPRHRLGVQRNQRTVYFRNMACPSLAELMPGERACALCNTELLSDLSSRKNLGAELRMESGLRPLPDSNLSVASSRLCTCQVFCHGDMNLGNVLVDEDKYYLVDWDLAGIGPRLFDEFSLVFHPDLQMDVSERLSLMNGLRSRHDSDCPFRHKELKEAMASLLEAKMADCVSWDDGAFAIELKEAYGNLRNDLTEKGRDES